MTESKAGTIGALLARTNEGAAREADLAQLLTCLQDGGPVVAWVHGASGSGKSGLIDRFAEHANDQFCRWRSHNSLRITLTRRRHQQSRRDGFACICE